MNTLIIIGFAIIIPLCAYIAWKILRSEQNVDPRLKAELEQKDQRIGELQNQYAKLQSEKDELAGKGKQMYDSYKNLEAELKAAIKDRESLSARVTKFETHEEQRIKRHEEMSQQLESAKKALEDEKIRIRKEDEEREQHALEERDRMWNEHENSVISLLTDLCKKPAYAFSSYDNDNLPEGFDGSLKPDFLISFLNQYIIFDAKVSRSQDLRNYIADAVKKTAKKVKGKQNIFKTIFLVVPTDAIATLKQLSFYEEEFTFYVVSPEALEPILASLKKIESYEFAQEMNPQERENIVDLIAQFDFHISTRNAVDYHLLQHGLETLNKMRNDPELMQEVAVKKQKMRNLNLNTADTKQLTNNPTLVQEKLEELTEPKAKISQKELELQ